VAETTETVERLERLEDGHVKGFWWVGSARHCAHDDGGYLNLALVDVELFVSSGAPRWAFTVLPASAWSSPTAPAFRADVDALLQAGWQRDDIDRTMQPSSDYEPDLGAPHPYALGPAWVGSNCWRAELMLDDLVVIGLVDHRWADTHSGTCTLGDELVSGSPWRWHAVALDGRAACGRAETPVLAASSAEDSLGAAGARIHKRTELRRAAPR